MMKVILAFKFVPSFYIQATWKGTIRHCCTFKKTLEPFCIFSKMYLSNLQMLKNKCFCRLACCICCTVSAVSSGLSSMNMIEHSSTDALSLDLLPSLHSSLLTHLFFSDGESAWLNLHPGFSWMHIFYSAHPLSCTFISCLPQILSILRPLYLFISLYPSILLTISTFLPSSTTQTPSLNIVPLKHSCVVSSRNTARQKSVISHLSSGDRKHR